MLGILSAGILHAAPLPDDLKIVITAEGTTQTLNLHKRTVRPATGGTIYRWSAAGGYQVITPEVRTFRGTVTENPNAIVLAAIDGNNRVRVRCIDMELNQNFRWETGWVDVSSQLVTPDTNPAPMPAQVAGQPLNGTPGPAKIGPKVPTGTAPNGVPYGSIVEFELGMDLTVAAYNRGGGNIDTVLADNELDAMTFEMMMLRDVLVRVVTPTIVIRTENFYASDPGWPGLGAYASTWTSAPLASARWDTVWGSEGASAYGGVGKNEAGAAGGAIYHETTHQWGASHLVYQGDTMGGNKPSIGPMTAERMLSTRRQSIDQNELPLAAPFTDPLPPHTYVDAVRTPKDTAITIDVMANDHDANGDTLSIYSCTTTTVPGGTVAIVGNMLRYTPPAGYIGKDLIAYTVQDSSAMHLKTRELVHVEVFSPGLMVSYQMEETSGTVVANAVSGGVAGDLNGANFATDRVLSPLGHGVRVNGFRDDNDIEEGDWSGMLVGSGNISPVPLTSGRQASPFDLEFNRHGGHYDIQDGDYTFATWFRSDSYAGTSFPGGFNFAYIASRWWHPETSVGWDMYAVDGTVGLHYRIFDGNTGIQHFSAPYNLVEGKWYHMAAVFDRASNQIRILVNGQVIATRSNAFSSNGYIFNGRAPLALGCFSRDKYCYDDVRVYSKALTTAEVQSLVDQAGAGTPRFFQSPLQYSAYAGQPFNQSLWSNIWSGGDDPLTFQILSGPAWLGVNSAGFLTGTPTTADAGLNAATVRITDSNGDSATATVNINIPAVPNNPLAFWKLDEGSGTATADSSGNGYHGTLTGATWDIGRVDGSLSLAGAGNQVSCGNVPASSQMSFAAWIKPTDVSGSKAIFGKSGSYSIRMDGSGMTYTRPGVDDYGIGVTLIANVWQHVVVTIDGSQVNGLKVYKNGVLAAQRTASAPSANSNPVLLGNNQWNQYFKGNLDHLQIFNSVLTPDQVGALHAITYGGGVIAKWKFDEGSGLSAADSSGNGNTGTLDSGIGWVAGHSGSAVAMTTTKKISLGGKPGPAGDWTFATWVQRKGDTYSAILVDSSSSVIKLEQYNNTHRVGITRRGVADWSFNYTTPINQWVHLTFVGGNGAVKLYVNGVLQDTLAQSVNMPFSTFGSATEGMNAWIDDAVVYERMLNAQEVMALYDGGANHAPAWSANPLNKPAATEDTVYTSTLAGDATDADAGDTLTYSKVSGPTWLSVASNGALAGTPSNSDVGSNAFTVRVTDSGGLTDDATLNITVANVNDAPVFSVNPITRPNANQGVAYSASIAGTATDVDAGDTQTYSKVSGPAWLSVAANGVLSGTPLAGDVGANAWTVRVTDALGATADATLNITVIGQSLPPGWTGGDIGSVGVAGTASESGGTYTVSGSGADIWNSADAFNFVSQTLVGDGEIRARVTSQTNTNGWAKAGVMIRNGTSANAAHAMMVISPGNGFALQSRSTSGGTSSNIAGPALNAAPNNWVRLTRSGSTLTAYVSANGTSWTQVGSLTIAMSATVNAGLAVCSHDNAVLSTATFDNVAVTPFPAPWLTVDIGTTGLQGSAEYFGSAYTVKGAGNVSGSADNFRFVYQSLSGDGQITARIKTPQNTGSTARLGVMIRDTLATNSKNAFVGVDGSGNYFWQRRSSTGGTTASTASASGVAPNIWVRVVRTGNTLFGYKSADGVNWTLVNSRNITMGANIYIGLAVSSGSTTTLNSSVMDNVTVVP